MKKSELKEIVKECVNEVIAEGEISRSLGHIDDAYKKRYNQTTKLVSQLVKKLKSHKSDFEKSRKRGNTDWGYVGDLGHHVEELENLLGLRG